MRELSGYRPVYAPDLPDNGASDPLPTAQPQIDDYAASVSEMVAELRLGPCDLYAVGAGAAVGLQLFSRSLFKDARIVLDTPDFYSSDVSQRLSHDWAPVLQPQWDGAHLNRIWLMLRDEYSFWPWFDRSPAAACARDVPSDAQPMHLRAVDILRSLPTYHRLTEAALRYEWEAPLSDANHERTVVAVTVDDPRRVHIEAATRRAHWAGPVLFEEEPSEKARSILRLLDEGARLS
jgi:pimeloyl-ACP methyl ester carboxylesterase